MADLPWSELSTLIRMPGLGEKLRQIAQGSLSEIVTLVEQSGSEERKRLFIDMPARQTGPLGFDADEFDWLLRHPKRPSVI